jgi:hypothetical protein
VRNRAYCLLCLSSTIALLAGCGLQSRDVSPAVETGSAIQGRVHGGQQPVSDSHVYLFAAGVSGYGGPSVSLISSGSSGSDALGDYVLTDPSGNFTVTGDYMCTAGTQVYLLSMQGNPGLPVGQNNANLGLMTALGQCPSSGSVAAAFPFVVINEVTTVASVYALSGFMTDVTHVSSSGTALAQAGIANAFAAVGNMVNVATGLALATTPTANGGNGAVPQSEINTLANIVASCVNSVGAASASCTTLFGAALNGTTQPQDTVTAALNIAHSPGKNVGTLFGLQTAMSPFLPVLSPAPNDFTIALSFTGGGLNRPANLAIDSLGDVWATNLTSLSELSSIGKPMSPNFTGYTGLVSAAAAIAIDTQGNVWVPNGGSTSSVSKIASNGKAATGSPFIGGGLVNPSDVAIDISGNAWITNFNSGSLGQVISEFNGGTGKPITTTGYSDGAGGNSVAVDALGFVWTANSSTTEIAKLGSDGSSVATGVPGSFFAGGGGGPLAIDASGNVWIAGSTGTSKLKNDGTPIAGAPFGGGQCRLCANGIAIDGVGNVWIADGPVSPSPSPINIAELNNADATLSPSTGFQSTLLGYPGQLVIDGSGNVWVADSRNSALIEFVGAGAPVVTPLAQAVASNMLGTRP